MTNPPPLSPIVCGTDFSENATLAATAAAVLSRLSGRPLLLMHAADEFDTLGHDPDELAAFLQPVQTQLDEEAGRLTLMGATVATQLLTGDLAQRAVLKSVQEQPVSLVVVSTVNKTALERWSMGSTAEYLARSVAAPTLVVRSSAPFEAWGRGDRPLKVLVAVNHANVSAAALEWVHCLGMLGPCEIVAAYLNDPATDCACLGVAVPASGNPPEVQQTLERELAEMVHARLGGPGARVIVAPMAGPGDARLIQLAVEEHADLIVVGTRQRQGINWPWTAASVSCGILRHAPMSIVTVPAVIIDNEIVRIPVIQRVLVATDGSAAGKHAVRYACALLPQGGHLMLLHVTQPALPVEGHDASSLLAEPPHPAGLMAESWRTLLPDDAEKRGITAGIEILEAADAAAAICQTAERFGSDVICLGSNGKTGLSAILLGSVSKAVLAQCPRPVLIVRPPAG